MASVLEQATGAASASRPALERRSYSLVMAERALVWFVLLILSGPPRMRERGLEEALESPLATLDPTAVLHVAAWAGTGALVVYILCRQPHRARTWLRALTRNVPTRWYLLFGLLGIASAAYSPSPIYTIFFAGKIIIGVVAVAMVCTFTQPPRLDQALRLLFAVVVIRAVALVLLYAVDPALVGEGQVLFKDYRLYGGPVIEDYGESALLAGLWLLTVGIFGSSRVKRTLAMLGYAASWLLLLASETRSAIATGLIFFVIMVSLTRASRGRAALFVVGALSLGLSVLWNLSHAVIDTATRSGSGINTLSGRTDAFDYLIDWWSQRPILGYGYGAGTRGALVEFVERTGLGIGAGHDVLSTVLVDLGLVGATVLAVTFLAAWNQIPLLWRRTRRLPRERMVVAQLTCLAVWITNQCIVGVSLEAPSPPFFVLIGTAFALGSALPARRRQRWHSLTGERPVPGGPTRRPDQVDAPAMRGAQAVARRAGLSRAVPAGLVDAGCASIASFAVGLYAARFLHPAELGAYALFFTAFSMAAVLPTQLFFSPAEIASLPYEGRRRLRLLDQSLRLGSLPSIGVSAIGVLAAMAGSAGTSDTVLIALAISSFLCTAVSPVQDHVRRLLHFAGRSWWAAAMSMIQLGVTVGALLLSTELGLPTPWVPFGALFAANVVSLSMGLWLAAERRSHPALDRIRFADVLPLGRWLMLTGLTPAVARFIAAVLITQLAGAATLGYVEAARLVSQPVFVLMLGLSAVLGPAAMNAAAERRKAQARLVSRPFKLMIVGFGLAYLLVAGFRTPLNPLPVLVPNAYVTIALLPLMILAQILQGVLQPFRLELTGAGRGQPLLWQEIISSAFLCLVSATAGVIGAFAAPLGALAQATSAWWLLRRARRRIYDPAEDQAPDTPLRLGPASYDHAERGDRNFSG